MQRGEVWLVDLNPTVGREMDKERRAIIISMDDVGRLPLRVVVPCTSWQERFAGAPWLVRIEPEPGNGFTRTVAADTFQLRSISIERMVQRKGVLGARDLDRVIAAVGGVIGLVDDPEGG